MPVENKKLLDNFFKKELKSIKGRKIVTYYGLTPDIKIISGNFDMIDNRVTSTPYFKLKKRLNQVFDNGSGSVVVRTFTDIIEHNLPVKKIRMYLINSNKWTRVPIKNVEEAHVQGFSEPEKNVIYE